MSVSIETTNFCSSREMDEYQSGEETLFVVDEITTIIKETVESIIGNSSFQRSQINLWSSSIVESSLNQLTKLRKPFKYIEGEALLLWQSDLLTAPEKTPGEEQRVRAEFCKSLRPSSSASHSENIVPSMTCILLQKNGAGLHTASSCFWDNTTDGSCTVRWENKTMYCIVSVFGLAI